MRVGFVRGPASGATGAPVKARGTMRRRFTATVHGIVQGVLFRESTRRAALGLGVSGTVRNLPDGTVRVVAEGDGDALVALLAWLERGPERAVVDRVEVEWPNPRGESDGFRVVG